jgi:hypothetical protein
MKASGLTGRRVGVVKKEIKSLPLWKSLYQRMKEFLSESFESDWEKKTGLPWSEWQRRK